MVVSDILDIDLLKGHRDAVQNSLDELSVVFEHLQSIKENIAVEEQKIKNCRSSTSISLAANFSSYYGN